MKFLAHDPDLHCCICSEPFVAMPAPEAPNGAQLQLLASA